MGKSSAPQTDYIAAAKAQGAANRETALAEWQLNNANQVTPWGTRTRTHTGPGDTDYTVETTLNPADQAALDKQRALQAQLLDLAPNAINDVTKALGQPMTPENLPPMTYSVDTGGMEKLDYSGLPSATYGVEASPIQSNLDFSGAPALQDTTALRNQVMNSEFNQFMSRFAPAAQQQQADLNTRLANMGGVTDSAAARRQMGGLLTSQGDQVRNAVFDAINKSGEEAQRQFGMNLGARQQAVGEIGQQGQFYNAAQAQQFGQGQENAALHNAALGQTAGLLADQVKTNNATTQQDIQNAFANANLANAGRAQSITEANALREMPLNELMAIMSGTQVTQPTFQPITATNIQPTPILQGAQMQGQQAAAGAANEANQRNSTLATVGTIAAVVI